MSKNIELMSYNKSLNAEDKQKVLKERMKDLDTKMQSDHDNEQTTESKVLHDKI